MAAAMMASTLPAGVYAQGNEPNSGIMPLYNCNSKVTTAVAVNGNKVECKSVVIMASNEKWTSVTQTIEKQNSIGKWYSTSNSWTKIADNPSNNYAYTNTVTLNAGTYRLRSDLGVVSSNGATETVTSYSSAFTI